MRKFSFLFIITGLVILFAPVWQEWRADREEVRLLREADRELTAGSSGKANVEINDGYAKVSRLLEDEAASAEEAPNLLAPESGEEDAAIATIEVDAIDLKLPVLEGATKTNMKHAAVHMSETATLGASGNAAIAAHRARTAGRLFNRLNEVEIDDKITIRTISGDYTYKVYKKFIVEPTDVSVLDGNGSDKILTLITCHPLNKSTHRLIIQAKLDS
ncbi:sortase A [Fontibacillus phaseoli]|uniref:Sortase A n=1 Tax=Fontibacillus phaseoli TaxID=1416533 RepID=A0A369BLD7_9BACL|nr:class D sortase [Fontibacillus phaseoli]RCX21406.1 sortase A [Fontibacillus phaseoli]